MKPEKRRTFGSAGNIFAGGNAVARPAIATFTQAAWTVARIAALDDVALSEISITAPERILSSRESAHFRIRRFSCRTAARRPRLSVAMWGMSFGRTDSVRRAVSVACRR